MKIRLSQLRKIIREEVTRSLKENAIKHGDIVELVGIPEIMKRHGEVRLGYHPDTNVPMIPTPASPFRGQIEFDGGDGQPGTVGTIYFDEGPEADYGLDGVWVTEKDLASGVVKKAGLFGSSLSPSKSSFNLN